LLDIDVAGALLAFIVLLFSLTIHESAHAWTADRLGDPTARMLGRVSLNPVVHADLFGTVLFPLIGLLNGGWLFGWAKPCPVNVGRLRNPRRDYIMVAAAGPLSNLLLAILARLLQLVIPVSPVTLGELNVSAPIATMLSRAIVINILLAVFNMIPIPPLDGGSVLAGLLPRRLAIEFNRIRPYGFFILIALMLSGALDHIIGPPINLVSSWLHLRPYRLS
jgi:Zn-dependent protease